MPYYIIKIHDEKFNQDYYMEWSTIVDAPITNGCGLEEFKEYYRAEYGRKGIAELDERLKRVEKKRISAHAPFDNLDRLLENNHAGENGTCLDKEGILEHYCRNKN